MTVTCKQVAVNLMCCPKVFVRQDRDSIIIPMLIVTSAVVKTRTFAPSSTKIS